MNRLPALFGLTRNTRRPTLFLASLSGLFCAIALPVFSVPGFSVPGNGVAFVQDIQGTDSNPVKIHWKKAGDYVDQEISTVMEVRKIRYSKSKAWCYLESTKKSTDKKKLTLVFKTVGRKAFQLAGIADPAAEYKGKRIRVVGKVELSSGKLQIQVEKVSQIKVVGIRPKKK